jgi:hypothetical protein
MACMLQRSATACPPLSRTTPLGRAVVPEVYRMYSGSVAATGTQPAGSACLAAPAQSRSRPSVRAAVAWGRCRITQCSGLWLARSMARSRIGLYSMTRLTSIPHEAVRITLGVASSIRVASSGAANPPNTTECTAPIRAHASMAISASGIIGRYTMTRSPLPTPRPRSTPANRATSSSSPA